jgi:hypothetical protein
MAVALNFFSEIAMAKKGKSWKKIAEQILPQTTERIVRVGWSPPQLNQEPNETATTPPSSNSANSSTAADLKKEGETGRGLSLVSKVEKESDSASVSKVKEETESASVSEVEKEKESASFQGDRGGHAFLELEQTKAANGGLRLITSAISGMTIGLFLLF